MNLFKKHDWILGGFEYLRVDNVEADAGSGGATFGTDEVGGVHYPRSKMVWGVDGTVTDTSASNPLPVVQTGTPSLPTGAATAAKQDTGNTALAAIQTAVEVLDNAIAGSEMQVDIVSSAAIPVTDNSASLTTDTPQLPATIGQKAAAASVSVVLASDQGAVPISDNSASLTTDTPQLPATLGQKAMSASLAVVLASDQASVPVAATLAAETTKVIGTVNVAAAQTIAATNAGTFVTQENGAALTALQLLDNLVLAEDAAHVSGDPGLMPLGVRRDANTTMGADGDYVPFQMNADGSLKVAITAGAGSGGTSIADDAAFTPASTSITPVGGIYRSTLDTVDDGDAGAFAMTANRAQHVMLVDSSGNELGAGAQYAEDEPHASGDMLTMAGVVRKDTATQLAGTDGDNSVLVNDANGRLHVNVGASTLPTGASTEATLSAASAKLPATLGQKAMTASMAVVLASDQASVPVAATLAAETTKVIGTVNVAAAQTIATTNAGTFAVQAGQAAHDAAIAGNPVRVGLRGMSADYTAVATGDTADALATLTGKAVTYPYALPGASWNYAAPAGGLVSQTAVTIKTAGAAGVRHYITSIQAINSHQTISTELIINDGAAGTVLWRGWLQAAGGGVACNFDPPLRGSAATLLEIDEITATGTAGVIFNCQGFSAAE